MMTGTHSDHVICYTTDINFLLPSIFSAKSVRQFVAKDKINIHIILFHDKTDDYDFKGISAKLAEDNIFLQLTTPDFYKNVDTSIFQKGHVPIASVGRFFLCDLLPEQYQHIIYLDGDTWVNQDPSPLIFKQWPENKVAFIDDYSSFEGRLRPAKFQKYWDKIGKAKLDNYFNAGIFASRRDTWKQISEEAFQFLVEHPEKCQYHDQSALNAVVKERRVQLSLKWNFQTNYKFLHLDKDISPVIYHFTRSPKAWEGAAFPWSEQYHQIVPIKQEFAQFDLPLKSIDDARVQQINTDRHKQTMVFKNWLMRKIIRFFTGIDRYEKTSFKL